MKVCIKAIEAVLVDTPDWFYVCPRAGRYNEVQSEPAIMVPTSGLVAIGVDAQNMLRIMTKKLVGNASQFRTLDDCDCTLSADEWEYRQSHKEQWKEERRAVVELATRQHTERMAFLSSKKVSDLTFPEFAELQRANGVAEYFKIAYKEWHGRIVAKYWGGAKTDDTTEFLESIKDKKLPALTVAEYQRAKGLAPLS